MKSMKKLMTLTARWLAVLALSFFVLSGPSLAAKPVVAKKACDTSCAARCPCCISKTPASNQPAPLAPSSSPRTVIAKDFQLASLLNALLLKERQGEVLLPSEFSAPHFSVTTPLFVRHCTFLI
jgi:hypothetical protein